MSLEKVEIKPEEPVVASAEEKSSLLDRVTAFIKSNSVLTGALVLVLVCALFFALYKQHASRKHLHFSKKRK